MGNLRYKRIRVVDSHDPDSGPSVSPYRPRPPVSARFLSAVLRVLHAISSPVLLKALLGFSFLGFSVGYLLGGNADKGGALVVLIAAGVTALAAAAGPDACRFTEKVIVASVGFLASRRGPGFQVAAWTASLSMREIRSPGFHVSLISALSSVPHFARLARMYSSELDEHSLGSYGPSIFALPYAVSLASTPSILALSDLLPGGLQPSLTSVAIISGKRWSKEGLEMASAMAPSWSGDVADLLRAAESLV